MKRFHPHPSESYRIVPIGGHEKSLTGKQARLEGEPSTQEEHVAETDMVSRLLANSRLPIIVDIPTVVNRVWEQMTEGKVLSPHTPEAIRKGQKGSLKVFIILRMCSKRDTSRQGVGRRPKSVDKLLCEQRRNRI